MARSINKRLRIASLFALLVGAFFAVNAMDNKDDNKSSNGKLAPQIYYYQLNSTNASDINNPNNYALTKPGNGETPCGEGDYVCSIVDEPNPSNPAQPRLTNPVVGNETAYSLEERPEFVNN